MFYKWISILIILLVLFIQNNNFSKRIKTYTSDFNIPNNKNKNFYNPSIIKYNKTYYTFHRECSAKHNLQNLIKLLSKQIFTSTIFFTHNNKLTKIEVPNIEDIPKYKKIVTKDILIKGYEDPRAIIIQKELILVCSVRANSNKYYQVCIIKIDLDKLEKSSNVLKCNQDNVILLYPHLNEKRHQKNWSPFIYNNNLHLVYSINPQIIFSCNTNTGKVEKIIETSYTKLPINKIRGGSNLIPWTHPKLGDVLITIAHGKIKWFYYHLFYICKKDYPFTILGSSDNFVFKNNYIEFVDISRWYNVYNIQFASTMITINDKVIIGYGEGDCKSKKCMIKITDINNLIKLF
jgi:predicted GH43/DUF377 family glycosyl hydrolase